MRAATNIPIVTESYGCCLITSLPRFVSTMWVPFAFVAWRQNGELHSHRFPELDNFFFSTETEARSAGFSTARSWADNLKKQAESRNPVARRLYSSIVRGY